MMIKDVLNLELAYHSRHGCCSAGRSGDHFVDQVCSENHRSFLKRVSYPVMSKRREDEA